MSKAQIGDVVRLWPNAHLEHGGGPYGEPEIEGVIVLRARPPNDFFVVANEAGRWAPLNDDGYADAYTKCIGHDQERARAVLALPQVQIALRHLL